MDNNTPGLDLDAYRRADEFINVFRNAVKEARSESHRRGVANVYYFDGKRYFELPSGEITQSPPASPSSEKPGT